MPEPPTFRSPRARRLLMAARLTEREMEAVRYWACNIPAKDVARLMGVERKTVSCHLLNAAGKFRRTGLERLSRRDYMALCLLAGEIGLGDLKLPDDNEA